MVYEASTRWLEATDAGHELAFVDLESLPGWHEALGAFPPGSEVQYVLGVSRTSDRDHVGCATGDSFTW